LLLYDSRESNKEEADLYEASTKKHDGRRGDRLDSTQPIKTSAGRIYSHWVSRPIQLYTFILGLEINRS